MRLSGPLFRTEAGAATLTLLAEHRRERIPAFDNRAGNDRFGSPVTSVSPVAGRTNRVGSLYAELRAPLFGEDSSVPLLGRLDVQLAVRRDAQRFDFARDPLDPEAAERVRADFAATAFTAGARLFPQPWLMVRGSYATGHQPPPLARLITQDLTLDTSSLRDPRRGNALLTDSGPYRLLIDGNPDLGTGRATTLSLGAVIELPDRGGPRLSIDYSRIRRSGDFYRLDEALVLAREDSWPERVSREPLSDADRTRGYGGGRITAIDARPINAGGLHVETVDGRLDWPVPLLGGTVRLAAAATLHLRNRRFSPFDPAVERAGYRAGPLRWRANGGLEWTSGRTTLGANLQYFDGYRIIEDPSFAPIEDLLVELQGGRRVRAQHYLDLFASRRIALGGAGGGPSLTLEAGIVNLLDRAPPFEANLSFFGSRYSLYGDPRGRRFELALSASF